MGEKRSSHMIERRRMTQELLSDAFELIDVFLGHDGYPSAQPHDLPTRRRVAAASGVGLVVIPCIRI
jgi:hypothetical protein